MPTPTKRSRSNFQIDLKDVNIEGGRTMSYIKFIGHKYYREESSLTLGSIINYSYNNYKLVLSLIFQQFDR